MRLDLVTHIAAGALGIIAGYVALATTKGGSTHRKSGIVFVYAMLIMSLIGAGMAIVRNKAPGANAPVGLLTSYLVLTALITVRPPSPRARSIDAALLAVVLGVTLTLATFAAQVLASSTGRIYGMPASPFLVFAAIGLLAAAGDARLIRAGGVQTIRGTPRLGRHLWRMTTAMLIAAFSFFLGQAKVIPKPIRIVPLLLIPPLVVLAALVYWLWRIRVRQSVQRIVLAAASGTASVELR